MDKHEYEKLKVFVINSYKILKKRQDKFFEEFEQERRDDDFLTVKQVTMQYSVSSKTVYRWIEKGLMCLQNGPGGKISIKRKDVVNFRNRNSYD